MNKEKQPQQPESLDSPELEDKQTREALRSDIERRADRAEREDDRIEEIRRTIEEEAKSSNETKAKEPEPKQSSFTPLDRNGSFKQTMTEVRSRLSKSEGRFSKVIHQPTVEKVSDAASKTVGRSSLLLGGFMATFIGSLVILMNARTNGYSISNLTFIIVLFAAGALIGVILEFIYRTIKRFIVD